MKTSLENQVYLHQKERRSTMLSKPSKYLFWIQTKRCNATSICA